MTLPLALIGIGLILVIISFVVQHKQTNEHDEIEKVSISLHRETNALKKRLQVIEEELMISTGVTQPKKAEHKKIHEIIVNQILSLHSQGFAIEDIAKRSSLTTSEVMQVLQSRGVK
ncbi:MAG TPA: hypothetical protein VK120_07275 [Sporosarcina sp.]|nr:hypothetical protein [Sporosarcina sp.]